MRQGYLLVEAHPDHPNRVRLITSERPPSEPMSPSSGPPAGHPRILYAALFNDLDVAAMHAHTALRRDLVDIDAHLYRTDTLRAVAALESIALNHRRIYLDPDVASDPRLGAEIARRQGRLLRHDRVWNGIGLLAVLLLLLKLVLGV